jgi:hypothetical protein
MICETAEFIAIKTLDMAILILSLSRSIQKTLRMISTDMDQKKKFDVLNSCNISKNKVSSSQTLFYKSARGSHVRLCKSYYIKKHAFSR